VWPREKRISSNYRVTAVWAVIMRAEVFMVSRIRSYHGNVYRARMEPILSDGHVTTQRKAELSCIACTRVTGR